MGAAVLLAWAPPASAQSPADSTDVLTRVNASATAPLTLTLDDAIRIALDQNYDVRGSKLDVRTADAQVREAWGQVLPELDASGSYTRNVVNANPFAGSDISSLFGGGTQGEWVAFNERARLDDDPDTEPITFAEFDQRQRDSLAASGVSLSSSGNPFGVDNEFVGSLTLRQTLFNGSAFSAISGAAQFKDVSQRQLQRQVQLTANQVYQAFYDALLAQEQARVIEQRVDRTQATLQEVETRVRQGVTPKFQRLSTEVDLANQRTELIQAQNRAGLALDQLKVALGLSVDRPLRLEGDLDPEDQTLFTNISMTEALGMAYDRRPDLESARLQVDLREVEKRTVKAEYLPTISAVANFTYSGRVPDNRTSILTDPNDPFFFDEINRGFFDTDFWNPSFNVGVQLTWNLFDGFQRAARVQQRNIAVSQAQLQYEQLSQQIELEVTRALRNLEAARERINSQQQNVRRAETNYDYTEERVGEGVSSQLELREASDQLDQSRVNYLQAVFDYLVARSDFQTAVGMPLAPATRPYLLTKR